MNGNTAKWNSQYRRNLLILYIFLNGFMFFVSLFWSWLFIIEIIFVIAVEWNFGRSFANAELFKKNPVKIFLLPPLSTLLPIIIFTIKAALEGGFKLCFSGCSKFSFGDFFTFLLIYNIGFLIAAYVAMPIAYFTTLKKVKKEDLANQRQIELKAQQAAAEKEAAETKALEDILKNRPE